MQKLGVVDIRRFKIFRTIVGVLHGSKCVCFACVTLVRHLHWDRTAATLLPILQQHLRSGTRVHSDQWRVYDRVQQLPSVTVHNTVNHSLNFVEPGTGVHTQNVESYWNRVNGEFKRMKGVHEDMIPSYLNEFMWRERHGRTASTALTSLFRDINLRYPQ